MGRSDIPGLNWAFLFRPECHGRNIPGSATEQLGPLLQARDDFEDSWWQQDGAPPHFALIVPEWVDEWFPRMWIGRRGSIEGPARSPDLTPPDVFLWGYLKDKVYKHAIQNEAHLRQVIIEEFNSIPVEFSRKACENVRLRLQACIDLNGAEVDHHVEKR